MTALPAPPPARLTESELHRRSARSFRVLDRMRLKRWCELRDQGVEAMDAWEVVATDDVLGLHSLRGKKSPRRRTVALSFVRFADRINPGALLEARQLAQATAAGVTGEMIDTIIAITRGRHGGGQDEAEAQENRITKETAPVASVQLKAAETMLRVAGVLRQGGGGAGTPSTLVQVNSGPSAHDVAAALRANPEAMDAAIDAGRIVAGVSAPTAVAASAADRAG